MRYVLGETLQEYQEEIMEKDRPSVFLATSQTARDCLEQAGMQYEGEINLTDVVLCLNHSSKKSLLTGDALAAADVNQDGAVNLTDVMRLMNYVAKKSTTL